MNRATLSIVFFALLGHPCIAETVRDSMTPEEFDRLYEAAVDIAMTCYGDPGNAIGIIGDTDGSILKALWAKHIIPVVLINESLSVAVETPSSRAYELQVFIIAAHSITYVYNSLHSLKSLIWWNTDANILIVDMRIELRNQCLGTDRFMFFTTLRGMLNVQVICYYHSHPNQAILIVNSNPFVNRAPKVWAFSREYNFISSLGKFNISLFYRLYREGGQSCESINFVKTGNVGGHPLRFMVTGSLAKFQRDFIFSKAYQEKLGRTEKLLTKCVYNERQWFIQNIVIAMNVSPVLTNKFSSLGSGIVLQPRLLSTNLYKIEYNSRRLITRLDPVPMYAVTQHTGHMSQLDKILSVIDRTSRMGMWLVYLITFLFFKFFLGQAVIPALLNIVRLTCGTGLTKLPQNVAPTLYLTSLFIFVVTLQAIYTGNLATLLTTTIPYPNVEKKNDIAKLGYTIHIPKGTLAKCFADPAFDGHVIEIPASENCIDYVLRDPLAVCALDYWEAILQSSERKLHVSSHPIQYEYGIHISTDPNLFFRRLQEIMHTVFEAGLYRPDPALERLRLEFVDDDEVKKNVERRVMTFEDLRFSFVILGIGLLCSIICFIGEIVIYRRLLKHAKRPRRVRVRPAWEVSKKQFSWFSSLRRRFNLRRLFSNRR